MNQSDRSTSESLQFAAGQPQLEGGGDVRETDRRRMEVELETLLREIAVANDKFRSALEHVHVLGYHLIVSRDDAGELEVELEPE